MDKPVVWERYSVQTLTKLARQSVAEAEAAVKAARETVLEEERAMKRRKRLATRRQTCADCAASRAKTLRALADRFGAFEVPETLHAPEGFRPHHAQEAFFASEPKEKLIPGGNPDFGAGGKTDLMFPQYLMDLLGGMSPGLNGWVHGEWDVEPEPPEG